MANSGRDQERRKWSEMEPHDEFLELSALSTAGDLTEEEQNRLQAHLVECAQCRQALKEFEVAVDIGVPLMSSKFDGGRTERPEVVSSVLAESAWSTIPDSIDPGKAEPAAPEAGERNFAFAHRNGRRLTRVNWNQVWLPFAACVLLSVALATYTYRVGKSHHPDVVSIAPAANAGPRTEAIERAMSDADRDRQLLIAQLLDRDKVINELRREIEQQSSSLEQMKLAQTKLELSIQGDDAEKQQAAEERNSLAQKLGAAEASLQKVQTELVSAREQKLQGQTQDASLQAQIVDLNRELHQREQAINNQDELLSHDRDIRDLMGARDLYIAEVYDVGRDGATQKPCGRVFYTKGKSLVFYAYDLDQQPGVRNARTFQAWGRRGADMQGALNLGIFFQDNAAKKRWVVKFDDAKSLEQIDAVFVTVEPDGGSHKPSGKPLLFAYLKIDANHP
jgi:hypothetical protein